uniref:Uncharacterized protein n=1 Tax=Mycena chlorophos TaxID=658473 RepID=A0ABQ0L7Q1_MYCCL|nr:predicted protein [Mycena chlorophos]
MPYAADACRLRPARRLDRPQLCPASSAGDNASEQIELNTVKEALILKSFEFDGVFASATTYSASKAENPCLSVEGVGVIGLPRNPREPEAARVLMQTTSGTVPVEQARLSFGNAQWTSWIKETVTVGKAVCDRCHPRIEAARYPRSGSIFEAQTITFVVLFSFSLASESEYTLQNEAPGPSANWPSFSLVNPRADNTHCGMASKGRLKTSSFSTTVIAASSTRSHLSPWRLLAAKDGWASAGTPEDSGVVEGRPSRVSGVSRLCAEAHVQDDPMVRRESPLGCRRAAAEESRAARDRAWRSQSPRGPEDEDREDDFLDSDSVEESVELKVVVDLEGMPVRVAALKDLRDCEEVLFGRPMVHDGEPDDEEFKDQDGKVRPLLPGGETESDIWGFCRKARERKVRHFVNFCIVNSQLTAWNRTALFIWPTNGKIHQSVGVGEVYDHAFHRLHLEIVLGTTNGGRRVTSGAMSSIRRAGSWF